MGVSVMLLAAALPVCDLATNSVNERVAGADPAVCLSRFVDYPPSRGKLGFPRCLFEKPFPCNEKFWLKDVDFSCASPWNDSCGAERAGTLISKRHVVFAKHFTLWKGVRILFVDQEGEVCPCNVEKTKDIAGTDITVGLLNAEVTPNIHPAKILPDDFYKHIGDGRGLPIVTLTRKERAVLAEANRIPTNGAPAAVRVRKPRSAARERLREEIVGGDSGNPAFLLVGRDLILLYCLHHGGVGSGPWLHMHRHEIQAAMDDLSPGYKLEEFDFTKVGATKKGDDR